MKSNQPLAHKQQVEAAADFLKHSVSKPPKIGILTGTGLGDIAECITVSDAFSYSQIPNFPIPTVTSHTGRLVLGTIGNHQVIAMQGRFHLYEGYSPIEVTFPIRVMQAMGVTHLFITNAAGGIHPDFCAGDIMVIRDHINLTGSNPLIGPNEDSWGIRFPDMSRVYFAPFISTAIEIGRNLHLDLKKGIYAGLKGPSLETPAEIHFLRTIGADAVGFSTVPEVIAAVHAGMTIAGLSLITNVHRPDNPSPTTVEEVIATANTVAPALTALIKAIILHMDEPLPNNR